MDLDHLRRVKRAVGIAGGKQKFSAIRGALQGRLINVLITDRFRTRRLLVNNLCPLMILSLNPFRAR